MSLRKDFVLKALAKQFPFAELCRQYGISRKTGYKWVARFEATGIDGLVDDSRRPKSSPLETTPEMSLEIVKLRHKYPSWGARKLTKLLERVHLSNAPSESTVTRVLERAKLLRKRRRRPSPKFYPTQPPQVVVEAANDVWTVDFKGWWRTGDGRRCEPLTVRDAFSRFVLDLRILPDTSTESVRPIFERLFNRYGVPKAIHSDNGPPFASTRSLAGLSKLSAWWVSLGITLIRNRPGCPQDNGAHERMHGDIRVEIQTASAPTVAAQQKLCDDWRAEFNHVRPHEALAMKTPAEMYRPSPRKPMQILGGFPERCMMRKVDPGGCVRFDPQTVYITMALVGFNVGLRPMEKHVEVWFFDVLLGRFEYGIGRASVEPTAAGDTPSGNKVTDGSEVTSPASTRHPHPGDSVDGLHVGGKEVTAPVTLSPGVGVTSKTATG